MQLLFAWDASASAGDAVSTQQMLDDGSENDEVRRESLAMAKGTWEQREMIDPRIERLAPQWPPRRQPGVDRNLLRLAVWELTNLPTPPKVVIDEAIELSKEYSTEQSAAFVNGVLDAILKENQALTGKT